MDLNEEGGSTKDVISQFIMRKYDVFQVHVAKLIEQLEKLVDKEELVFTSENHFVLPAEDTGSPADFKQEISSPCSASRFGEVIDCKRSKKELKCRTIRME